MAIAVNVAKEGLVFLQGLVGFHSHLTVLKRVIFVVRPLLDRKSRAGGRVEVLAELLLVREEEWGAPAGEEFLVQVSLPEDELGADLVALAVVKKGG